MPSQYFKTILVFILFSQVLLAQNLISNPNFEDYSECPSGQGDFFVANWYEVQTKITTPDYFNACADYPVSVPENLVTFQNAHSGDGYIGLFWWGVDSMQREYVFSELITPLQAGRVYEFSMFVNFTDRHELACNNLGALFTDTAVEGSSETNLIEADPQIRSLEIIFERDEWVEISGEFEASGGEKYVTIGNFFSDEDTETQTVLPFNFPNWSYYLFDSLSLTEKPLSIPGHQNNSPLTISPNPASETLVVANSGSDIIKTVTIFDMLGREVMIKAIGELETSLNLSELRNGNYFLSIEFDNGEVYFERIIKH